MPVAWNIPPNDSRFAAFLNEATERLLVRGRFWGTYSRYLLAASQRFISLPPRIDTMESIAVGRQPLQIRSQLFEFLSYGWGTRDRSTVTGSGVAEAQYLGSYPTAFEICDATAVTVVCDNDDDVGKEIRLFGEDANGNYVRTENGGSHIDGEIVTLAKSAGTASATVFADITGIQAPADLVGQWYLYAGTVAAGTLIGTYEHWDTHPSRKRYLIPWINADVSTVEIIGKNAFIPVVNDTDFLVINNLAALKLAGMAIQAEERHDWAEAQLLWEGGKDKNGVHRIGAINELHFELQHHEGAFQRGITIHAHGDNFGGITEPLY